MNIELDKKLCSTYPEIFRDRFADKQTTAMCWGFECGPGWYKLIDGLCRDIMQVCRETGCEPPVATQVKEKYGTLRFYVQSATDEVYKLIDLAEELSSTYCEECGLPGKIRKGGWIRTLCDHHAIDYNYEDQ